MMLSKVEFLDRAQLDQEILEVWIEEEWLVPSGTATELAFSEVDLARAKLIRDLMRDLGVNDEGVGVILHLLDQVHGLRKVLADMLQSVREQSTPPDANSTRWTRIRGANDQSYEKLQNPEIVIKGLFP